MRLEVVNAHKSICELQRRKEKCTHPQLLCIQNLDLRYIPIYDISEVVHIQVKTVNGSKKPNCRNLQISHERRFNTKNGMKNS